jgi:hypothetical protein
MKSNPMPTGMVPVRNPSDALRDTLCAGVGRDARGGLGGGERHRRVGPRAVGDEPGELRSLRGMIEGVVCLRVLFLVFPPFFCGFC